MPQLTQAEIKANAVSFVHEWKTESRERAEAQTFWNEFLEIFGVKRRRVAVFEKAVKKTNQNTGAIDLFWRGVLLAEHKSRGQNLDKATSQAFEYLENLPENDLPKTVIISDFAKFPEATLVDLYDPNTMPKRIARRASRKRRSG